jgi:hypothetical protein
LSELKKFKNIESPFTALNFRYEGLGSRQPVRQLSLGDVGLSPGSYEKLAKSIMLLREYRLGHT